MRNFFFQNHSIMYRKRSMIWKKGVFTILSDLSGAYFSVTNFFVFSFHTGKLLRIFMLWKNMKKKKKLGDCWITDEIIKQRNHHSSFEILQKRKDGYWIIYWSGSDRTCIFSISSMEGKINSIVEPYAIRKRCLYGCSILSLFVFFIILYLSRLIVRDRGNLYYVKSSG